MNRIGIGPNRALAVIVALLIVATGVATALAQALGPAGPTPAGDHADIVAQAVVDLPAGDTVWRIRNIEVDDAEPPIQNPYPAFVTTDGVAVLVSDEERTFRQRLASGEATVLAPWHDMTIRSLGPRQTVLVLDVLPVADATLTGSAGSITAPFEMEAGSYDVDLIRVKLNDGDASQVPLGNGPAIVIVRQGQASIDNGDDSFTLASGANGVVAGEMTVTGGADGTVVLVARIGADVGAAGTPEPEGPAEATPVPATPVPSTPIPATPASTLVPATPAATPDSEDRDDDGLTDVEENELGTDPNSADTDEDGIFDGDEQVFGTDPLNLDTDGDILYDGGELLFRTDPLNPDTDGDAVSDGNEVYFLETDPTNPDTDGDGVDDFNDSSPLDPEAG